MTTDLQPLAYQSDLTSLRQSYEKATLTRADLAADPVVQFDRWITHALQSAQQEPYAMTLATANAAGRPSARIVLLRQFDARGFVFYSNYDSHKGQDLTENPYAELLFFWASLEQQVRIAGRVERLTMGESTAYFHQRPHGSQVAACASLPQSGVIESRDALERRYHDLLLQYPEGSTVPKPEFWGGFRLVPDQFEFWQGRRSRLHDRLQYRLHQGNWIIERLMP